ncbi:hypothetical protein KHA80_17015 [Anaerobacillus sp. HL2]|nr:hypothetical protein KHA80_17015 [Anaerobacillus sp. HL2]
MTIVGTIITSQGSMLILVQDTNNSFLLKNKHDKYDVRAFLGANTAPFN